MKLQRYEIRALDDWGGRIHWQPSDAGQWCAAAHVEQLKAENTTLHAECDRLTAMLGQSDHPDDTEVNAFAMAMKAKLKTSREKGRSGWQSATPEYLTTLLLQHVEKGDVIDIANFCMMLYQIGTPMLGPQKVLSAEAVTQPGFYWWKFADHRWVIVIARYDNSRIVIKTILGDEIFIGKFIGPLNMPEVQG